MRDVYTAKLSRLSDEIPVSYTHLIPMPDPDLKRNRIILEGNIP